MIYIFLINFIISLAINKTILINVDIAINFLKLFL